MLTRHLFALTLVVAACSRENEKTRTPAATSERGGEVVSSTAVTPADLARFGVLPMVMAPAGMVRTPAMIALGRRLFHEPVLSEGHDVSCNSCHALNGYGADGRKVSFGDLGHAGDRNAPSVYNAAGQIAQFWDGRAKTVEDQAKGPILNPGEMAMPDSSAVLAHMRGSPEYVAHFKAAFPNDRNPVTYDNVGKAIGAFERGLVTPSRWDRYLAGDKTALTPDELRGFATFTHVGCANCHNGPYVGGQLFMKLGAVKPWPTATDSGRFNVTHNPADMYVFKVPSLRNVEKTGPYFHDGSVASLDSAIRMMGQYQLGVALTDAQVRDIRTWLGTLTGELPAAYIAEPQRPELRQR